MPGILAEDRAVLAVLQVRYSRLSFAGVDGLDQAPLDEPVQLVAARLRQRCGCVIADRLPGLGQR